MPTTPPDDPDLPTLVARSASHRGELVLRRRPGGALELRANGVFVMDTVQTTTERALAAAALTETEAPRSVLVGGLGLGFTLAEVLADERVRTCTVVEIEPALVAWLRDGTVPHGPDLLSDPRVEVVVDDVAAVLTRAAGPSFDLVLLDVDNGPGYLVHEENAALYRAPLLAVARRALRPGGQLVVWSADRAPRLHEALVEVYAAEQVRERPLAVRLQGRDEQYWLYVARVPSRT